MPLSVDEPGFKILGDPAGAALALGTHSDVHGKAADPARHMVSFDTDDIDDEVRRLKEQSVEFIEEPPSTPDAAVRVATFKDPEGNYVQLLQFMRAM